MIKRNKSTTVDDFNIRAVTEWNNALQDIKQGIINRDHILFAMGLLNSTHSRALREGKRYLLK